MKYNYLWILLLTISISVADIPDITLSWDTFLIIEIDSIESITDFFLPDSVYPQNEVITPLINGAYLACSVKTTSINDEIHISKFNQNGQEIWNKNISIDSAGNLEINSVIELENNSILITGTSNGLNSYGVNVCLDSSGDELWQRTDWYLDFTSFQNALEKPNENYLITGWTASENEETFSPGEMNILLVEINDNGELITGIEIQNSTGSQQPLFTFSINDKIIIIGKNILPESDKTEFFLGIIKFQE